MPPSGEDEHAIRRDLLTFEEAARLVLVFASAGIRRVRFTGGEPFLRDDLDGMVISAYRHCRPEYITNFYNVINWPAVAENFERR